MADEPKHRVIALEGIVDRADFDRSLVEVRGIACGIVERDGIGVHQENYVGFLRDITRYREHFLFFYGRQSGSLPVDIAMLRASAQTGRVIVLQGALRLRSHPDTRYELLVSGILFAGYQSLGFERKA